MPEYRRSFIPGGTFFFTVVTYHRNPIFSVASNRRPLREAWKEIQHRHPFKVQTVCLLPDHIHYMWALPENDSNYPKRWRAIKTRYTQMYLSLHSEND